MARTKNAKRARVEGESSAPARLIASSHYMARWLPSRKTLNNYVKNFESREIIPPRDDYYPHLVRAVYSTLNYVVPEPDEEGEVMPLIEFDLGKQHYRVTLQELTEQWSLGYHGAKFTGGIVADEEWGEYNRLVGLQSLQYENPHMDARGNISCSGLGIEQRILMYLFSYMLIPRKHNHGILFNEDILVLWAMVTGKEINWPYFMVHHMLEMKKGKSSVGLGYACHWTKIFKWLEIDLTEEKSVVLTNVAKIDDSTLRQIGRDPDAQQPQAQGQPQDQVQAQTQTPPPPSPPSPTMKDLMDELRSMRVYMEEQFADMRQRQDRQTEAINRQGEAIDSLCTNLGITNPRGIIPRPGP
ncbi:uncharacterized protein DS421_4g123960 [Arachis hypogaea]|nr:uncharacterized protein DS421_4g123960 [Arachis hypogaea]